jgi:hypothetical protein
MLPRTALAGTACGSRTGWLTGRVIGRDAIDICLTNRLYELFSRSYAHLDRATFERDQDEKDWILLLSDVRGLVQGFTTLKLYELDVLGQPIRAVFSGNTIIDRRFWGEQELVATWCRFMAEIKRQANSVPLYWFLICSGYRTYMYLPLFFYEFYPRYDRSTPTFERTLINTLGQMKFREEYRDGVVHVSKPRECLAPELALPRPSKLNNPHVRFFFDQNPGCLEGDELVCITEFSLANTKRMAHAMAREVLE